MPIIFDACITVRDVAMFVQCVLGKEFSSLVISLSLVDSVHRVGDQFKRIPRFQVEQPVGMS